MRSSADPSSRPPLLWVLLVLLVLLGVGGTFGGVMLTTDPSGGSLKVPPDLLHYFPDYLIPGLILLVLFGLFPFVVTVGLWRRQPWAWFAAFAIGCGLVIFELVEVAATTYNFQQPLWGGIGGLIALVCLAPSVQRYAGLEWGRRLEA